MHAHVDRLLGDRVARAPTELDDTSADARERELLCQGRAALDSPAERFSQSAAICETLDIEADIVSALSLLLRDSVRVSVASTTRDVPETTGTGSSCCSASAAISIARRVGTGLSASAASCAASSAGWAASLCDEAGSEAADMESRCVGVSAGDVARHMFSWPSASACLGVPPLMSRPKSWRCGLLRARSVSGPPLAASLGVQARGTPFSWRMDPGRASAPQPSELARSSGEMPQASLGTRGTVLIGEGSPMTAVPGVSGRPGAEKPLRDCGVLAGVNLAAGDLVSTMRVEMMGLLSGPLGGMGCSAASHGQAAWGCKGGVACGCCIGCDRGLAWIFWCCCCCCCICCIC
mmetsp:Transcript_50546/g.145744  ORF Transcript_50546/g.145744 Transcript_50546/m.145744 type:complete len:350 (-) Transcript_50546:320-1369(-)